ncbi:hypothetical protein AB0I22_35245 [Streptomyces sp. NPDC050610]|uniref:hypothetical protein n=1 Tax=Streptomyces sp. NPDC050610 TaxID=3157097 RepID=UPI00344663CA
MANGNRGFSGRRWLATLAFVTAFGSISTGCSQVQEEKLNYKPVERDVDTAKKETKAVSSQLLDMMGIKGKVTQGGPGVSSCEDDDAQDLYLLRHPWSLYEVPDETLEKGMANLRKQLPEHGWKILKDGKANSKDQDPEILAENKKLQHAAHITWNRQTTTEKPMIHISVVSACFRAPEGTDLNTTW